MKKTLISLAVASVFAAPVASVNAAPDISGFADIIYTGGNKAAGTSGSQFGATGEIDLSQTSGDVTVRADIDFGLLGNGDNGNNSGSFEQAMFAWKVIPDLTVIGGVFNDPIGQEAEDAPDLNFTSHGAVYNVLDNQTVLAGNNVAGAAVAGAVGPVTLTGAVLNDLNGDKGAGTGVANVSGDNSLAIVANISPIQGLDAELGYVTQSGGAGDVIDFNASYNWQMLTVGLDYLVPTDVVDSAYDVWVKFDTGMGINVGLRFDGVTWDNTILGNVDDNTATTLYASYHAASNLDIAVELKNRNANNLGGSAITKITDRVSGLSDGNIGTVEFIATF